MSAQRRASRSRKEPLTSEQRAAIEAALAYGFTDTQIAKTTGISAFDIYLYRRSAGISRHQVIASRLRTWAGLVANGTDLAEIASTYQLKSAQTVEKQLWKAGFSFKTHLFTELTANQKANALELATQGLPDSEIAKEIKAKEFQVMLFMVDQQIANNRRASRPKTAS